MHLNQEDIASLQHPNLEENKSTNRTFSFDMQGNSQILPPNPDGLKEPKKDIIIEPLEVFELENEINKDQNFSSGHKDSSKNDTHQSEDDQILKAYNPEEESKESRNKSDLPNIFMSPKFKSFEDHLHDEEKFNIVSSDNKSSEKSIEEVKEALRRGGIDVDNESSNQRHLRAQKQQKEQKEEEKNETEDQQKDDHKAELRRLLGNTFFNKNKNNSEEDKEGKEEGIISPKDSDYKDSQNNDYIMSPMNEDDKNLENVEYLQKKREELFNNMN